ncbi:DnaJ-like subfamily C member 7, partial [Trifolium medium]|nr:DnaJ-like subfamily C member 7 [Trifolium medium]
TAFRTKAKQYHPDQNQEDRVAAEAKFKEVMGSYEAIQQQRKNHSLVDVVHWYVENQRIS